MFVALRLVASIVSICLVGTATPEVARRASDGQPLWVAATAAFQEDGQLRRELFSDYARERFDRVRARNIDNCTVFTGGGPLEIFEPMDSFEALVAHAKAIVAGEVIGAEQVFYAENAGTLYTIETSRTWKLNGLENGAHAFLFVGSARIETPRGWICAKPPFDAPVLAVGDHLLFFAYTSPLAADIPIFQVDPRKQLAVESKVRMAIPEALNSPASDLNAVIERVDNALKSPSHGRGHA